MTNHSVICPICKGEGFYIPERYSVKAFRITQAKKMKNMGLTVREIAQVMGYKSPESVQRLLSESKTKLKCQKK